MQKLINDTKTLTKLNIGELEPSIDFTYSLK